MSSSASLVTYSAPSVRLSRKAAMASLRSYYFRMYVCNFRQRCREACVGDACTFRQLREWFAQAGALAVRNPYLAANYA